MIKRGKRSWVPASVLDEAADIRMEDNLRTQAEAFRKMIKYAQVGREVKRLYTLDFSKTRKKK